MTQHIRLSLALLTSATVHVAILLVLAPDAPPAIPGIRGEAVRVTLMAPHKSASGPQATKPRAGVQSEDSTNPLDETPRNRQASVHTRSTTPPASEEALLDASANDTDAATITSRTLQVMLHEAFVAYFHYPSLARQNGWQGELRLGLRIEPNGELVRIRILTSSGYGILDRAAIRSLEAVRRLPHAAALLKGSSLDLILPVRYQLFDS